MIQEMLASASFGTRLVLGWRCLPGTSWDFTWLSIFWTSVQSPTCHQAARSIDDIALAVAEKVLSTGPAAQLLEDPWWKFWLETGWSFGCGKVFWFGNAMSFPNALSLLHLCLTWALRPRNCTSEQCWIDTSVFFLLSWICEWTCCAIWAQSFFLNCNWSSRKRCGWQTHFGLKYVEVQL